MRPWAYLVPHRYQGQRSGPRNLGSPVSVISARRGGGIARMGGEDNGKKAEKESWSGVQGGGGDVMFGGFGDDDDRSHGGCGGMDTFAGLGEGYRRL